MRHTRLMIAGALALQLLAACSDDDTTQQMQTVTMTIPIEVYSSSNNEVTSRAASQGDPGNDVVFEQPLYLYVYACVGEKDASNTDTYELLYKEFVYPSSTTTVDDYSPYEWTLKDEDTKDERWTKDVDVTFKISTALTSDSRVFAIASRDDLSKVLSKTYTTNSSQTGTGYMDEVKAITANLSTFTSAQLKDIYSTPLGQTDNGVITSTTNNNVTTLTCSAVRLYHVAAKVDFTWEVASKIQSTTELASINCTGLPTTCKVFEPTNNPTGAGSCLVLGASAGNPVNEVNAGNKWLGRAYAFMLQPPSTGEIKYTVTYSGSANKTATTSSITPDQTTYSNVFTGWYRIVATVE